MSKNAQAQVATATAKLTITGLSPEQMVSATHQIAEVVKKHPEYGNKPEIQQCLTAWVGAADTVEGDGEKVKAARLVHTAAITTRHQHVAAWKRAKGKMLSAIDEVGAGSAEVIKQWGFAITGHQVTPASTDPPRGLRATYTKAFALVLKWADVREHRGYFLQLGDGTPQGWGGAISCPRASYTPEGFAAGQKVAVRIAVQRKNGLSAWSDALTVTIR